MSNSNLPAVLERTAPESAWRALEQRAATADALEARVAELEQRLARDELRAGTSGDPRRELLTALLPVLDSFAAAISSVRASLDPAAIVDGVALAEQEMRRVLSLHGVEKMATAPGDAFDLDAHQTLAPLEGLVVERPVVAAVLRDGYLRDGRVLRRAIVTIEE